MEVQVDRGLCDGIGMCEALAPEHFEVGDDGVLTVLRPDVTEVERGQVEQAVEACPLKALQVL